MSISIFLAKVLGLYLAIVSIPLIFRCKDMPSVLGGIFENRSILFLFSLLPLLVGIILVVMHNIWVWDWRVAITLFAWAILLSGMLRFYFPGLTHKLANIFMQHWSAFIIMGIFCLALGEFLIYRGFFVA